MTQQEQIYMQGFMDKCASVGVDGEALLKEAARGDILRKALEGARTFEGKLMNHAGLIPELAIERKGSQEASRMADLLLKERAAAPPRISNRKDELKAMLNKLSEIATLGFKPSKGI